MPEREASLLFDAAPHHSARSEIKRSLAADEKPPVYKNSRRVGSSVHFSVRVFDLNLEHGRQHLLPRHSRPVRSQSDSYLRRLGPTLARRNTVPGLAS